MSNVTFSIHKSNGDIPFSANQVPGTESLVMSFETFKELFVDDKGWFNAGFSSVRVDGEWLGGSRCMESCLIFRIDIYGYISKLAADAAEGKAKSLDISVTEAIAIYVKVIAMIDLMEASGNPYYMLDIR